MSKSEAARVFGIDRKTVRKILEHSVPPGYLRSKAPARPKLDPFIPIIDQILEADRALPKKQRHTATRIFERLRDEHGFTGKLTIVTDYVREKKCRTREVFVPLAHPPGHAQVDLGEALGEIGGVVRKIRYFALALPYSDAFFMKAYPAETTEACLATGTSRRLRSSAACRCRSCTTTRFSRWRGSWTTGPASAPASSRNCSRTTCSRIGSATRAREATRVTWRA
jgi:transposase